MSYPSESKCWIFHDAKCSRKHAYMKFDFFFFATNLKPYMKYE
jgi:hypothetical protein